MFGFYILIFGIFLALLEIEIEGESGWAKNLPTWKKTTPKAPIGLLRNLTGYHLILNLMILSLNHIIFVGFFGFVGLSDEFFILAFHFLLLVYWDFLWFLLNPHFTFKKFRKEHIAWYTDSSWIMGFPIDYWYGIGLSALLAVLGAMIDVGDMIFQEYITTAVISFLIWGITLVVGPLYHRWYYLMRK